ncbi:MAG: TRAP transporter substrate-binding protein DctP [Pigmentiphaga sp.]|nr:TRAP transporter substrate-binding protein DctP [Pigmentiphaga sp.]
MDIKKWLKIGLLAGAIGIAAGPAQAQQKLLLSTFFPTMHPLYSKVLVPWAEAIEEKTDGRVVVEFSASSLAPPPVQFDMVQRGIADIAVQSPGMMPDRLRPDVITELPGVGGSAVNVSKALWRTHEAYFDQDDRYRGVHLLSLFAFPPQAFFCVKPCPTSVDEMSRLRMATLPSTAARQYGKVTSGVVAGPMARFFELASKGTIDAYGSATALDVLGFNLASSTEGALRFDNLSTAGSFALVMNPRAWAKLSPQDQAIITELSGEAFAERLAALDEAESGAWKKLEAEGVTLQQANAEMNTQLAKEFAFLDDEWTAAMKERGIDGAAALGFYREQLRESATP